jgi:transposase-like protein
MLTRDEASALTDADSESLSGALANEEERRAEAAAKLGKAAMPGKARRGLRCPACHSPPRLDGRGACGAQRCRRPSCGGRFPDASATSLAGSKLTPERIRSIVAMVMLGSPDWAVARVCRVDGKTAQYWRDRCLDAAEGWSGESALSGHVWIGEMRFAPTRASGFVDGVWEAYVGRISRDACTEAAFDSAGHGFRQVCARLEARPRRGPAPQRGDQKALARRRLGEMRAGRQGIQGQDVADEQPPLVPPLQLREAPRGEIRQARRLRRSLHAPAFPRPQIRPRGDDRLPLLGGLRHGKEPQLQGRIQENADVARVVRLSFAPIYVLKRNLPCN